MSVMIQTEVFSFDELEEKAKGKARDWYREGGFDHEWWDFIFDDATEVGRILGFTNMKIMFSGFSSQGDGACFTGEWRAPSAPVSIMREYAPKDERLTVLASDVWDVVRKMTREEKAESFSIYKVNHRYSHENTVSCDRDDVLTFARDFMRWIYKSLMTEWDYMNSDEQVSEAIRSNEYTFTVEGKRFG